MSDQEVRKAVSEQVVQSAETIESLRIKVVRLEADLKQWQDRCYGAELKNERLETALNKTAEGEVAADREVQRLEKCLNAADQLRSEIGHVSEWYKHNALKTAEEQYRTMRSTGESDE